MTKNKPKSRLPRIFFIFNCQRPEIIPHLVPIQMGDAEPKDFPIATREEMGALWHSEEESVMQAEFTTILHN